MDVGLGFFFGKSSKNSPKPMLIFWSSIPCVFCLKVVGYYDLSVLSMPVMGFQKKEVRMVGHSLTATVGVSSIQFCFDFRKKKNFAKPLSIVPPSQSPI